MTFEINQWYQSQQRNIRGDICPPPGYATGPSWSLCSWSLYFQVFPVVLKKMCLSVSEDWVEFRDGLSECMDSHTPFKFSSSRNDTPWIAHNIKRQLRRKQRAFNHARATGRDDDLEKFHAIRKETQRASKRAYWKWVRTRCVESSKQFRSFVKKLRRDSMGIPALRKDGLLVSDDVGKAEIHVLNAQFESVFTSEEPMDNLPSSNKSYPIMPDIHVSLDGVVKLLSELQENKAPGPDAL